MVILVILFMSYLQDILPQTIEIVHPGFDMFALLRKTKSYNIGQTQSTLWSGLPLCTGPGWKVFLSLASNRDVSKPRVVTYWSWLQKVSPLWLQKGMYLSDQAKRQNRHLLILAGKCPPYGLKQRWIQATYTHVLVLATESVPLPGFKHRCIQAIYRQ